MVGVAFVFLVLRGWVRVLKRNRISMSDLFVGLSWLGFVADSAGLTRLYHLGFELSPSTQSTVNVSADPEEMVGVFKVRCNGCTAYGRFFTLLQLSILQLYGLQKPRFWYSIISFSRSIRKGYGLHFMPRQVSRLSAALSSSPSTHFIVYQFNLTGKCHQIGC
jgi:hypothetical protein